ncbi:MAG: FliI/YscN family ATPase [Henriciella sp.]|nr:FliI/YscN family ATPase [Henriciella sp.]
MPHHLTPPYRLWGAITEILPGMIEISGVGHAVGIGDSVTIEKPGQSLIGEVMSVTDSHVRVLMFSSTEAARIGDRAFVSPQDQIEIGDHWLGALVNYRGEVQMRRSPSVGQSRTITVPLQSPPTSPADRKPLGNRLNTGLNVTDTLLPICRGQRIGLFAGSGVGKSTLLGKLAGRMNADRIVIALIGERSREVQEFIDDVLPADVLPKTTIVAATASEPPGAKKRAAFCAIAAAEYYRDQGHSVLFLFDSLTRFAEAHRETALMAGETPALNAFPPSTVRVVSELAERTGPGTKSSGDITAIFSVLVAGSDFEEPVADMVRGILDGHIVLSRKIAERGRYPAIDVLRSVSRSLPKAATGPQNQSLQLFRTLMTTYDEIAPMVRAGLYEFGKDPNADIAYTLFPELDRYLTQDSDAIETAFDYLDGLLQPARADLPAAPLEPA